MGQTTHPATPADRPHRAELICLAVIVLIAAVPRLYMLDIWPGVGSDQAKTGVLAYRFCKFREISWNPNIDYIGPVQTILMAAMRPVFGTSVWTIRTPVAIMAIAAVIVAWAIMRPLVGTAGGLTAALIAALYPWLVISSRYALDPMWLLLPNAFLLWTLGRYLRHDRPVWLVVTAALAGLGLTLHPAQIIVLPGLAVGILWGFLSRAVRFRPVWVCMGLAAFLIVAAPVLPYHIDSLLGRQKVATKKLSIGIQDPLEYLGPAVDIITGRQLYQYFGGEVPTESGWQTFLEVTLVIGLLVGGVVSWRRGGTVGRVLVVYFLVGALFGYFFCSGMNRLKILGHFRYLICLALLLPMFWSAAIAGLTASGRWRWPRLIGAACLASGLAIMPWQLVDHYFGARARTGGAFDTYRSYQWDPKQLAAWYIRHNQLPPESTIILAQDYDMYYPLRFFLEDDYVIQSFNPEPFIPLNDHYPFQAMAANPEADWLVALYAQSNLGRQIVGMLSRCGILLPEHLVYEVASPRGAGYPSVILFRIPPSPARTDRARQWEPRNGELPRFPTQGHTPPSGTGKIRRSGPVGLQLGRAL